MRYLPNLINEARVSAAEVPDLYYVGLLLSLAGIACIVFVLYLLETGLFDDARDKELGESDENLADVLSFRMRHR